MLEPSAFAYNAGTPLELVCHAERRRDGATIQDITYASPAGGKASAYLIFSVGESAKAGLIFGHWGEGNREEFVEEAVP